MFSKKMIIALLGVACLAISNNSEAMWGKIGYTTARSVGHGLGFGLAGTAAAIVAWSPPFTDYS